MRSISRVRRMGLWGLAVPVVLLASALGALATGSGIGGDNPAVVQESLTLVPGAANAKLVLSSGDSTELVVFNQDTSFAGAAETYPGDSYAIKLLVINASNADVVQRMTIDAPDGFDFRVEGGSRVSVSQETAATFLVRVSTDADGDGELTNVLSDAPETDELRINVRVGDQVVPGFYRIKVDLAQFAASAAIQ